MTPKRYYTFMIDVELADALREAKRQSSEWSEAAIIRQALREWFTKHGVKVKTTDDRKRASTRRRP
jgi:hypothetical protein